MIDEIEGVIATARKPAQPVKGKTMADNEPEGESPPYEDDLGTTFYTHGFGPDAGEKTDLDISIPSPEEMAKRLSKHFTEEQANAITLELYQPVRTVLRDLCLRGIR